MSARAAFLVAFLASGAAYAQLPLPFGAPAPAEKKETKKSEVEADEPAVTNDKVYARPAPVPLPPGPVAIGRTCSRTSPISA